MRLLHEGVIAVQQLHGLSYGQSMAAVSPVVVSDLCQELLAISMEGAWVALDVAYMYVYSDSTKWSALIPTLKSILSTKGMLRAAKPEWRMDAHAFAKVAEKLVEHDKELAAILTREVIDATMQSKHVPGIDHCMKEVLASLLEKQVVTVWPLVASDLEGPDNLTQWRLADLLRNRLGEVEGDLLGKIPFEYLAQWSAESPEVAPAILAGIVQTMKKMGDDSWVLSTEAMFLLDNYGSNPSVLSALGANINSFSWSGSLVPFFKRQMTVLQPLNKHPIAEVRQWSQRLVESATHQIQKETARDEEMGIGRFS